MSKVGLKEARDNSSTGGGISQGVGKFLHEGGTGKYNVWARNAVLSFSMANRIEVTHGVPGNDHREESEAIRRWYMGGVRSRRQTKRITNPV